MSTAVPSTAVPNVTTVGNVMSAAQEALDSLTGLSIMTGFAEQLKQAIEVVKSVSNPKMNYRSVQNLISVTELTNKVLKVMEDSSVVV